MLLKEVCNLLATAWKVSTVESLEMQISLIIEVVYTRHSQIAA
jgi:hypothetical protein